MKLKTKKYLVGLAIALLVFLYQEYGDQFFNISDTETVVLEPAETFSIEQKPLAYSEEKQLVMADLDHLGRATNSHIQLKFEDLSAGERENRLKYNPVGWHNYQFSYGDEGKKAWLFNRGHLIGYRFSGLNDEARNLVQMTSQLNQGAIANMDSGNEAGMLFYESKLAYWLRDHPTYRLDYQVTAIYRENELTPRQLRLAYLSYDSKGLEIPIILGSSKETQGNHASVVVLDNISDNAEINYLTGEAKEK